MFSDKGVYRYTVSCSRKHKVPKVRAFSLDQIRRGDHLCFDRVFYWHHAIAETVDKSNGEVNVIEYSNSAKQLSQGNSSPPGLAVVVRRKFKLENEPVYVIKHDSCFDPEAVVSRAKSRLGERKYDPVTNNCEHFALWCKTGISSSEQVRSVLNALKTGFDYVTDTLNKGWLMAVANAAVKKRGGQIWNVCDDKTSCRPKYSHSWPWKTAGQNWNVCGDKTGCDSNRIKHWTRNGENRNSRGDKRSWDPKCIKYW